MSFTLLKSTAKLWLSLAEGKKIEHFMNPFVQRGAKDDETAK